MVVTAFVFPGQGAQVIGMGRALAQSYQSAASVFAEVDDALDEKLSELIWEGDIETLTLTENAQPALMATSLAVMAAFKSEGIALDGSHLVAGHSLGEYSALCAAGAISLRDTAKLLRLRGKAMQNAAPRGQGAMAAILGLDAEKVKAITIAAAEGEVCEAANDNDPSQIVISGHKGAIERAIDLAKSEGAKRALLLPVSAPFHCQLMQPAQEVMAEALADTKIARPLCPVVQNVTAKKVEEPDEIRQNLIAQVTGSVRWRESILTFGNLGVARVFEIGAGKALSGMVRRIDRNIEVNAVSDPDSVAKAKEILRGNDV